MWLEKGLNDSKENTKEFKDLHDSKEFYEAKSGAKNNKNDGFLFFIFFKNYNFNKHPENIRSKNTEATKSKVKTSQADCSCLVCFDNFADAVFLDCGHGGICYKCAIDIWKSTGECFLCRKVENFFFFFIKIFFLNKYSNFYLANSKNFKNWRPWKFWYVQKNYRHRWNSKGSERGEKNYCARYCISFDKIIY